MAQSFKLDENLPNAVLIPSLSTAGAAANLLQEPAPFDAAVAPRLAADRYGLDVLADALEVPKRDVRIVSGDTARQKLLEVVGLSAEIVRARLLPTTSIG